MSIAVEAAAEIVVTDEDGVAMRKTNGDKWTHRLQPDADPIFIAKRLTKQIPYS